MNIGKLKTRILIKGEIVTRNEFGEELKTYSTRYDIWAKQTNQIGKKFDVDDTETAISKTVFYCRFFPDVSTKDKIEVKVRYKGVDYPSLEYKIESVDNIDNKELKIMCEIIQK
jgi:head-tail adaptor